MARLLVLVPGFKSSACIICTLLMWAKLGKVWKFRFRCLCVNSDLLSSIRLGKIGSSVKCGGPFAGLCYGLQKLDLHYLYAADGGKAGQGLEF